MFWVLCNGDNLDTKWGYDILRAHLYFPNDGRRTISRWTRNSRRNIFKWPLHNVFPLVCHILILYPDCRHCTVPKTFTRGYVALVLFLFDNVHCRINGNFWLTFECKKFMQLSRCVVVDGVKSLFRQPISPTTHYYDSPFLRQHIIPTALYSDNDK
jgi:hypothetical protein